MDDIMKEKIIDAETKLRDYMMEQKEASEEILSQPFWQGVMVSLSLDVSTSNLDIMDAISTLLALGWIAGVAWETDPEFKETIKDFPSGLDVGKFWEEKVQEVIEQAKEDLLRRPGE